MAQYLLSNFHPEGETPPREFLEEVMGRVAALNAELKAAGAWVFAGGLHPTSSAQVVEFREGQVVTRDGPFELAPAPLGGFWIVEAADLGAAVEWGRKAARACTLPIEVRPFHGVDQA